MKIDRIIDEFFAVTNYVMLGGILIGCLGVLWGMGLFNFKGTWLGPYMTQTNVACAGMFVACSSIFLGFKKYSGQDIRDVPRRRRSMQLAFFGFGLISHASMLDEGTGESSTLFLIAIFLLGVACIVWSQNRLDTWFMRYRETTSQNSLWNTLGL